MIIQEKNDYILMLEEFIKNKLFTAPPTDQNMLKTTGNKPFSLIQLQEKVSSKNKAGPVLKSMLLDFPTPDLMLFRAKTQKIQVVNIEDILFQ